MLRLIGAGLVALGLHGAIGLGAHELTKDFEFPIRAKIIPLVDKTMMREILERIRELEEEQKKKEVLDVAELVELHEEVASLASAVETLPEPPGTAAVELDLRYDDSAYVNEKEPAAAPPAEVLMVEVEAEPKEANPRPERDAVKERPEVSSALARQLAEVDMQLLGTLTGGTDGAPAGTLSEGIHSNVLDNGARGGVQSGVLGHLGTSGEPNATSTSRIGTATADAAGLVGVDRRRTRDGRGRDGKVRARGFHDETHKPSDEGPDEATKPKRPSRVRTDVQSVVVAGGLDGDDVTRSLRRKRSSFRKCFQQEASDAIGTISFRLQIGADGRVVLGDERSDSIVLAFDDDVAECVLSALSRMRFGKPKDGSGSISFQLAFRR